MVGSSGSMCVGHLVRCAQDVVGQKQNRRNVFVSFIFEQVKKNLRAAVWSGQRMVN
jgi:hypothetical protein